MKLVPSQKQQCEQASQAVCVGVGHRGDLRAAVGIETAVHVAVGAGVRARGAVACGGGGGA